MSLNVLTQNGLHQIHTIPPIAINSSFTDIPTDCIIYVPQGSLSAYKSASNYPNPNTYTYVEYQEAI